MWPSVPTDRTGALKIGPVDQECQARVVTRHGQPYGAWVDDTTFNAQHDLAYYVGLTVQKYQPLDQTIFVCVPPGEPHLRHRPSPPIVNVQEWYPFGMGCAPSDWGPIPAADAYCLQRRYPGTHGKTAPTDAEFRHLLAEAQAHKPRFIWLF